MNIENYPFDGEFTQETRETGIKWAQDFVAELERKGDDASDIVAAPVTKSRTFNEVLHGAQTP